MPPDDHEDLQKEFYDLHVRIDAPKWKIIHEANRVLIEQTQLNVDAMTMAWRVLLRFKLGKPPRFPRLKLEHVALLVMSVEQTDERLGDLDEQRAVIAGRHGPSYARLWYSWTGFWIIVAAICRKIPGQRLLELLTARRS